MRIAILTSFFYQKVKEIPQVRPAKPGDKFTDKGGQERVAQGGEQILVQGEDRIIFGGAERFLVELCHLIKSQGHEVHVYQQLPDAPAGHAREVRKEYKGIPITCIPVESQWQYTSNTELNNAFNELSVHFDLRVYFATFVAFPHVVRPAITISHGIFWDFNHSEYRMASQEQRQEWLRRQMYGFTAPDVCVAVDSNVRRVIQAMEPGLESRIRVIPNFVDTSVFTPRTAPKDWEGTRVLYPRRLTSIRGSNYFIKASRDYPQYNYVACGQSNDANLDADAKAWGKTTPHIDFIWRPMDEMPQVYQMADIAVVPTKAAEGLSLSLLEAMATGLPIVTTPVGGIGDAVIDGYNALFFDPNHDNLGEVIHHLAQNPDVCELMGRRNREIAVQCFDISIWRRRWADLLAQFA